MKQIPLTIITGLYSLPLTTLTPQLWQLSHQTVQPLEILVISTSPDIQYRTTLRAACKGFELVRVIDAPQVNPPSRGVPFNASRAANVGIRQSSSNARFVSCLSAGLLFNETAVEAIGEYMSLDSLCEAQMATLPADYDLGDIETLWQRWDDLVSHLDPFSRTVGFAPGSLLCLSRDFLFRVHGYDETNYPLAYNDSDMHHRAAMSNINLKVIPWGKLQMVHIDHPRRYDLPIMPDGSETTIIRNDDKWGEYAG